MIDSDDDRIARLKAAYEAGEIDDAEADRLIRAIAAERLAAAGAPSPGRGAGAPSAGEKAVALVRGLLDDARTLRALRAFCDAYLADGGG